MKLFAQTQLSNKAFNHPTSPPTLHPIVLGKNKWIIINCRIATKKVFHNRSFFAKLRRRRTKTEVIWNFLSSSFLFKLSWKSYWRKKRQSFLVREKKTHKLNTFRKKNFFDQKIHPFPFILRKNKVSELFVSAKMYHKVSALPSRSLSRCYSMRLPYFNPHPFPLQQQNNNIKQKTFHEQI